MSDQQKDGFRAGTSEKIIHDDNDDDGRQLLFEMQYQNTVSLIKMKLFLIPQFRRPLT
jgi:hypothetical protein